MHAYAFMLWGVSAVNTGIPSCPCASSYTPETDQYKDSATGRLIYTNNEANVMHHLLPNGYGLDTCDRYDENVPECTVSIGQPAWCMDQFCYVGPTCVADDTWEVEQEDGKSGILSAWFPDSKLRYSYATCGTSSYFSKYHAALLMSADELFAVPEQYVQDIVVGFEEAAVRVFEGKENDEELTCEFIDSCDCPTCENRLGSQWEVLEVDLRKTSISLNAQERGEFEGEAKCLGRQLQSEFRNIAQQTYNDPNRIAYMYFGFQENGALIQWPAVQWCPEDYDPRFRPWYAAAASGPKDVVLILDNSGSMLNENRWTLLKKGVVLVLRTLTEYDYVGVLLFSSSTREFMPKLMPATIALKEQLLLWINDSRQDPMGGTNFNSAFETTFSFIKRSRDSGATTRCQATILFMTDGEDTSGLDVTKFDGFQKDLEPRVVIFTYTFGSGATRDLPEKIACLNKGVYWSVPDGGNIGQVMSSYYTYFASGVTNRVPRWVAYTDALTEEPLMSACLPAYRDGILLGVGCMDVNMMVRLSALQQKPEYPSFISQVQASSSKCAVFALPEDKLKEIREEAGTECGGSISEDDLVVPVALGSSAAAAVLIIIVLWWCYKKQHRQVAQTQGRQPAFQQQNQDPQGHFGVGVIQLPPNSVNQTPYGQQPQYEAQQYGAQQPQYGAQQPQYGAQQPQYGAQQPQYGAQQPQYGAQQPQYGAQQVQYGAQQPQYGAQQPQYGAQQPQYGAQQPQYMEQDSIPMAVAVQQRPAY